MNDITRTETNKTLVDNENRDPITGTHGAHPVGTGIGAAVAGCNKYRRRSFDEVESDLGRDWANARGKSNLGWDHAKNASRDAWDRASRSL